MTFSRTVVQFDLLASLAFVGTHVEDSLFPTPISSTVRSINFSPICQVRLADAIEVFYWASSVLTDKGCVSSIVSGVGVDASVSGAFLVAYYSRQW